MGFDIKDLTGLGESVTKFLDVVQKAFGAGWRPHGIRREADAKAYEIEVLAEANAKAERIKADTQHSIAMSRVHELAEFKPEIAQRAHQRVLLRDIEGQSNLEAVVEQAYLALPATVSKEPINETWRRKFFQEAEEICDEDFQMLWGKILAGEISSPGSYSLRTLSVLRVLTAQEAELFRVICSLAMSDGAIATLRDGANPALEPFSINYQILLHLRDAGLLLSGEGMSKSHTPNPTANPGLPTVQFLTNNGVSIQLTIPPSGEVRYPVLVFTTAGRELQRLMVAAPNEEYLRALGNFWRSRAINVKRGTEFDYGGGVIGQTFEQDL